MLKTHDILIGATTVLLVLSMVVTVITQAVTSLAQQRSKTSSPINGVLIAGSPLTVIGFTVGERIENNANWYADPPGNYVWAGATDVQFPGPAGRSNAGKVLFRPTASDAVPTA